MTQLLQDLKEFLRSLWQSKQQYNFSVTIYTTSQFVTVQKGCTSFMVTNVGDDPATVNGMRLLPSATPATVIGDSRSIGAHKNDTYQGNLKLSFDGAGASPAVEIVQVYYMQ